MANLKDLKNRIKSVKSTQKITSAMKMVAAAKLRRAQENAEQARPYSTRMSEMITSLAVKADPNSGPVLLVGTGATANHLLVVVSADRGLCGGFNGGIIRSTRREVLRLQGEGKTVRLLMVGRKATDALKREFSDIFVETLEGVQGTEVQFSDADKISQKIQSMIADGSIDTCSIVFNKFISAIAQEVTFRSLVPVEINAADAEAPQEGSVAPNEYEPDEASVLTDLLPRALTTEIYASILESSASELAARMTAMDNATRNAGDLIDRLTMVYNRSRQAAITTELIEIISGAEAL
ncbi:MAG: F0F1 ATP synthase subunit gamma [Alphaproteobacteria bacterium]|nr:F0F1 ATP synthase subunit gamma [Alphaproteobacteria bacterium]